MLKRFEEKYTPEPNTGCWLWEGAAYYNGYGAFSFRGRNMLAHRAAYILHVGEVASDICVLHKCDVRACVNPAHLFLGTKKDNTADMYSKGRESTLLKDKNLAKTHCPSGHVYGGDNLFVRKNGHRVCLTCENKRRLERWYADRAKNGLSVGTRGPYKKKVKGPPQ